MQGAGLGQADACNAVAVVMGTFPEHRTIQMEACRAVEALADGNEENVRLLGEAVRYLFCRFANRNMDTATAVYRQYCCV